MIKKTNHRIEMSKKTGALVKYYQQQQQTIASVNTQHIVQIILGNGQNAIISNVHIIDAEYA